MARKHKRGQKICVPSLLAGVALGAMIIYFGASTIRTFFAGASGTAMSVGGCPYTVDVTGQPYSISSTPGLINFPYLPSGMTSVTGVYPPATGPY